MATCDRGGKSPYKRHQYRPGIDVVDGVEIEKRICIACGKEKVDKLFEPVVALEA